jgi:hypothetical protein
VLIFYVLLFGVVYLAWYDFTMKQRNGIKSCADLGKCAVETLAMIRQAFVEEIMRSQWKSPNSLRPKKARQVKSRVNNMLIIFSDIKWDYSQRIGPGRPNSQFHILL